MTGSINHNGNIVEDASESGERKPRVALVNIIFLADNMHLMESAISSAADYSA